MSYGVKAAERLAGKTVLLTGASSGIGYATALELAAAANGNIRLILAARRADRLEELKKVLESKYKGISVFASKLDVSEYKKIPAFVEALPKEWASVDVLINNAGLALGRDNVGTLDFAEVETMFFTNVLGLIALTNAFIPQFRKRGSGDVVLIGSIAARDHYPGGSIYCSTKSSLRTFANSLRKETIDTGIRVMEFDPGAVETEFSVVRYHGDKSQADNVYAGTEPLTADDIAEFIVFGLSRRANTVMADTLIFPSHQASSSHIYKRS